MLMIVNFFSPDDRYDDVYLSNFATIYVKDELLRVYGVSDINYMGQRDYSIRVWLEPQKLASRSMTAMDVADCHPQRERRCARPARSARSPASRGQPFQLPIDTLGRLTIRSSSGRSWSRRAAVIRTIRRRGSSGCVTWPASSWALRTTISLARSTATRRWASPSTSFPEPMRSMSPTGFERRWRSSRPVFRTDVDYDIAYDTTPYIRESVFEVFKTLRDAVILVGIVVLVFLQDWRAMILPMIDVPVSLIGTFAVMAALGFSLNNLTLFGLVLAIGIVVDDAIVVLENVERMIATGLDARTATIKAMEEITGPILAITLALCVGVRAVLFPGRDHGPVLSAVRGDDRRLDDHLGGERADDDAVPRGTDLQDRAKGHGAHELKREALPWWFFAVLGGLLCVLVRPRLSGCAAGTACSLEWSRYGGSLRLDVLGDHRRSISRLPARWSADSIGWLIIRPVNAVLGWLFRGFNSLFDVVTHGYSWTVGRLLRVSLVVLLVYAGLVVLTYRVFQQAPTGFIPQQDQGRLIVNVQLPDSASLQRTQEAMTLVNKITRSTPGVAHTVTSRECRSCFSPTPPISARCSLFSSRSTNGGPEVSSPSYWRGPGGSGRGRSASPGRLSGLTFD